MCVGLAAPLAQRKISYISWDAPYLTLSKLKSLHIHRACVYDMSLHEQALYILLNPVCCHCSHMEKPKFCSLNFNTEYVQSLPKLLEHVTINGLVDIV